ncbi:hypothetical protein B0T19DRAFT_129700 [Cercophora scortea]|uniref:Apple domain-containing protein n=1 Tax=Cercophora scortea TaxID=314031 RepID=A0AAE0MJ52_9PEZI|nr:hypothetical protein B0T19DRAFT_129700 [Cercophora scortea]
MDEQQQNSQKDAAPPTSNGADGIELSDHKPKYPDDESSSSPGMQVVEPSTLEVVQPRQGLSNNRTWEKTSGLPEPVVYGGGHNHNHHGIGTDPASPWSQNGGTPHTPYGSVAPAYYHQGESPYDYGQQQQQQQPPSAPAPAPPAATIAGLRRQTFWVVLAIGVFLAVVAIAVGVGVGVSQANKSGGSSTPSSTPTPAQALYPSPTAQGTTGPDQTVKCPLNNLTLYTSQADTSKRFVLLCGRDFNSDRGTLDLYNEETHDMSDCIDACAKQPGCVGAGWGPSDGVTLCWLKSYIQFDKPNWSAGWYFAIKDNSTTATTAAAAATTTGGGG